MPPSRRFTLKIRPEAELDVVDILQYTEETWGVLQRDKYADKLVAALEKIAKTLSLGKRRDAIKPGYLSYHVGRHYIFYRVTEDTVEVIRLLYDGMQLEGHFPDEDS